MSIIHAYKNTLHYGFLRILFAFLCIFLVGCASVEKPLVQDEFDGIDAGGFGAWNAAGEIVPDKDTVSYAFSLLESSFTRHQKLSLTQYILDKKDQWPLVHVSSSLGADIAYSHGFAEDTFSYSYEGNSETYSFPYSLTNKQKLASPECIDDTTFDTILCYMPRVNALYGPFENVFAAGQQVVYMVSSYQSLSQQHILDLGTQKEFPGIDGLYLLYAAEDKKSVIGTHQGDTSLYRDILVFRDSRPQKIFVGPASLVYFQGDFLFVVTDNNDGQTSAVSIISLETGDSIAEFTSLTLGERSIFALDDTKMFVYYVDVSFIQEEEFYYVTQIDRTTGAVDWTIQLPMNFTFDR